jgi:dihydroneopterin aldolase
MPDVVGFRGLRVSTIIGVREHERRQPQPIEVDVECEIDAGRAAASDELSDTVSYSDVARTVESVAQSRSHGLLERLAEELCRTILDSYPAVSGVTVEVRKPQALPGSAVPHVRLRRRR